METKGSTTRANALRHELYAEVSMTSAAPPEAVYRLLADLRSHATWGGERQAKAYRLRSIDAPEGAAVVGTEFSSVGADPMGEFRDTSVVTDVMPASLFGFVTEATLTTKKGQVAVWTNVHRYEIASTDEGCVVTYSIRVTRISALPGMLRLFNTALSPLLMRFATRGPKRGLRNLILMAQGSR